MGESHFADGNCFDDVEASHLLDQRLLIQSAGGSAVEATDEVGVTAGALLQQLDECVTRLRRKRLHLRTLRVRTRRRRVESLSSSTFFSFIHRFYANTEWLSSSLDAV